MAIENTPLIQEVREILTSQMASGSYLWEFSLRTMEDDMVYYPFKVTGISGDRNYSQGFCEEHVVTAVFPGGKFHKRIWPKRHALLGVLRRVPINNKNEIDANREAETYTFRAFIQSPESAMTDGSTNGPTEEALDMGLMQDVKIQLIGKAAEQVAVKEVGGNFINVAPYEVLKFLLTRVSSSLELDEEEKILGVDMYDPSNKGKISQIAIRHGRGVLELKNELQVASGGVYNTGMGVFLQNRHWYVYPLYDLSRFEKDRRKLTIIKVPDNRLSGSEKTFRVVPNRQNPDAIYILATGSAATMDTGESRQLNSGNGVRYSNADVMFNDFMVEQNGEAVAMANATNTEYRSHERKTGVDIVRTSGNRVTNNNFHEASRIAARMGSFVMLKWENADPSLLFPGMGVRYLYEVENVVREMVGVLQSVQYQHLPTVPGLAPSAFTTTAALTLFVGREQEWD